MRLSGPILMMSDIGLTLAKIGLSKPNVKLVIMSSHGKTGLMIGAEVLAYEKDLLTGKILSALHPSILTRTEGFEKIERDFNGYFDVAASNAPFGDFAVADPAYAVSKVIAYRQATKTIHNYFFLKALDQVREGGRPSANSRTSCENSAYRSLHLISGGDA